MFLDLRSSTTIAEQLGHVRFSSLLQECFFDMTNAIVNGRADVYQYVGDEVVLSWPKERGLENSRCVRCYFEIRNALSARRDHYLSEYGIEPVFKAGLHLGWVTVSEVGIVKREICYHGDVLNTAGSEDRRLLQRTRF